MSDSESDSDEFQSADEGFSDNEVTANSSSKNINVNVRNDEKITDECCELEENIDSEANVSQVQSTPPIQYRKRPERIKTSPSKSFKKASSIDRETSPSALSPTNINNTLQQTSATIKDFVINSIPLPPKPQANSNLNEDIDTEMVCSEKYRDESREKSPTFAFGNLATFVPSVTHISKVHQLGSKVISGGLGTLENIGKKTMQVLQESDATFRSSSQSPDRDNLNEGVKEPTHFIPETAMTTDVGDKLNNEDNPSFLDRLAKLSSEMTELSNFGENIHINESDDNVECSSVKEDTDVNVNDGTQNVTDDNVECSSVKEDTDVNVNDGTQNVTDDNVECSSVKEDTDVNVNNDTQNVTDEKVLGEITTEENSIVDSDFNSNLIQVEVLPDDTEVNRCLLDDHSVDNKKSDPTCANDKWDDFEVEDDSTAKESSEHTECVNKEDSNFSEEKAVSEDISELITCSTLQEDTIETENLNTSNKCIEDSSSKYEVVQEKEDNTSANETPEKIGKNVDFEMENSLDELLNPFEPKLADTEDDGGWENDWKSEDNNLTNERLASGDQMSESIDLENLVVVQNDVDNEIVSKVDRLEVDQNQEQEVKEIQKESSPCKSEVLNVTEGWDDWGDDEEIINVDTKGIEDGGVTPMDKDSFQVKTEQKVDTDNWGNWGGDGDEESMNRSNIIKEDIPVSVENIFVKPEVSKEVVEGWDDWGDGEETEKENVTIQKPDVDSQDVKKESLEGWDDWGDDVEEEEEVKIPEATVKQSVKEKGSLTTKTKAVADGWDDWGDGDNKVTNTGHKTEVKKADDILDESWDNWGEEEEEAPISSQLKKSVNLPQSQEEKQWQGWEKFGAKEKEDSWGWGSWGVNSLLSTATAVSQGLSTVLESGLGVPDPETLAAQQLKIRESTVNNPESNSNEESREKSPSFGIGSLTTYVPGVSQISKIVEVSKVQEISSKVIYGGLDTLENIGKKTMEVLQEGDPGLKKKKAILLGEHNKPVLSQMLREAKEKAEHEDRKVEEKNVARKLNFEWLFDDFQGLVHLEALEMLSRQCELKLDQAKSNLPNSELEEFLDTLDEVNQLCEFDDETFRYAEFSITLVETVLPLQHQISVEKILEIHKELEAWFKSDLPQSSAIVTQQKAISTLAELTAAITHQYHKAGELLLIKERRKTVEEADTLLQMSQLLCTEINNISSRFSTSLRKCKEPGTDITTMVTSLRTETDNAVSYIKQAFTLLVPVLQLGAI